MRSSAASRQAFAAAHRGGELANWREQAVIDVEVALRSAGPDGMTQAELVRAVRQKRNTISPVLIELQAAGKVFQGHHSRLRGASTGSPATVWFGKREWVQAAPRQMGLLDG